QRRAAAKGDKGVLAELEVLARAEAPLGDARPIYRSELSEAARSVLAPVFLLTNKPVLVVVNIGVDQIDSADAIAASFGADALAVCIELEADPDVVASEGEERARLLADLGVPESVVPRLPRSALHRLARQTLLT